jgi:hypothetical protein
VSIDGKHGTVRVMRHLGTLIAAIVLAPAAWLLIAFGQSQSVISFAKAETSGAWPAGDFLTPLLLLAGAGLILGLLTSLRFSPLGAVVAGLVYVASYAAVLVDGKDVNKLLDYTITIANHKADLRTPIASGSSVILGGVLLVGVASAGRWRRWPSAAAATASAIGDAGTTEEPTKDFWTPGSPASPSGSITPGMPPVPAATSSFSAFGDDATTERTEPNQFGSSPWRSPPGENATEQPAR